MFSFYRYVLNGNCYYILLPWSSLDISWFCCWWWWHWVITNTSPDFPSQTSQTSQVTACISPLPAVAGCRWEGRAFAAIQPPGMVLAWGSSSHGGALGRPRWEGWLDKHQICQHLWIILCFLFLKGGTDQENMDFWGLNNFKWEIIHQNAGLIQKKWGIGWDSYSQSIWMQPLKVGLAPKTLRIFCQEYVPGSKYGMWFLVIPWLLERHVNLNGFRPSSSPFRWNIGPWWMHSTPSARFCSSTSPAGLYKMFDISGHGWKHLLPNFGVSFRPIAICQHQNSWYRWMFVSPQTHSEFRLN